MSVLVLIISLAKTGLILIYKPDVGELAVHITIDKVDLRGIGAEVTLVVHDVNQESDLGMEKVGVVNVVPIGRKPKLAVASGKVVSGVVEEAKTDSCVGDRCTSLAYNEPFDIDGVTVEGLLHTPLFVQKLIGWFGSGGGWLRRGRGSGRFGSWRDSGR